MILISNRWSHHADHWYQDPTQCGLLTGITLSNKHSRIRLLSSYWPVPHAANQHSLSLHAHFVQFLQQHNPLKDSPELDQHHPLSYIQDLIMRETHKQQRKPNHQTLLLGDLNSSWIDSDKGGTHPALQRWANRTGWQNPGRALADQHPGARICTNWASITPVFWIDHILLYQSPSMLSLLGSHLARAPTTTSDKHRLYWNSFRVPGGPPTTTHQHFHGLSQEGPQGSQHI